MSALPQKGNIAEALGCSSGAAALHPLIVQSIESLCSARVRFAEDLNADGLGILKVSNKVSKRKVATCNVSVQ